MHLRPLLLSLLITTCLAGNAHAAMLAPETDLVTDQQATKNTAKAAPDSIPSLKAKLDAARGKKEAAQTLTKESVKETPSSDAPMAIIWDTVAPVSAEVPAKNKIAKSANVVAQDVTHYETAHIAPAHSDLHDLLFDDGVEVSSPAKKAVKPSAKKTDSKPLIKPAAPEPAVAAKENTSFKTPPIKYIEQSKETWKQVPAALPAPIANPAVAADVIKLPAVEIRKAFRTTPLISEFKPQPSKPAGNWSSRNLEPTAPGKKDALCLLQNRFENDLTLVIGQDSEGSSMMAVNYGIDILENREYKVKVQIDKAFEQELPAIADMAERIVIPLGKNPGFFSVLQSADALHVEMPGIASTFSLSNLSEGLAKFSKCLADIQAPAMPAPVAQNSVPIPQLMSQPMPEVPIPAVAANELNMPQDVAALPVAPPLPMPTAGKVDLAWQDRAMQVIRQSNLSPAHLEQNENFIHWTSANGVMQANVHSVASTDILDASSALIDQQEKSCPGKFSSQMGVPDSFGDTSFLLVESKCVVSSNVTVSAWVIRQQNKTATIWQFSAPRDSRGIAFETRDKIISALKKNQD